MSSVFVVRFYNLTENIKNEFEYTHLFDALRVAKETNVSEFSHVEIPALTESEFDENLLILLTTGIIYGGRKTPEFPNGDYLISLLRRDDNEQETVVYGVLAMPSDFKLPLPQRPIPLQEKR